MNLSPVVISIPLFFTLIGIELLYEVLTKNKTYRLNDSLTNINLGILSQITGVFTKIFTVGIYTVCYEYFAIYKIPENWLSFTILFILYDLCFYWTHRLEHEISLFWGGHVVHHQSESYNLSVALRQTSTGFLWTFPFYLPLAIIGFNPMQMLLVGGFNLLYQFWIHTEHINKLPTWFEYFFNTPSHHRVHHGRNPKYIDKNYAGVFIIWDRLFKTFKKEEERPTYGITTPINSWNPLYVNFAHYIYLWKYLKQTKNIKDKFKILFNPPGWLPNYLGGYQTVKEVDKNYKNYNKTVKNINMKIYILLQFIIALLGTAFFLFKYKTFNEYTYFVILMTSWIVLTMLIIGFYFEVKNKYLLFLELLRLLMLPLLIYIYPNTIFVTLTPTIIVTITVLILFTFYYYLDKNKEII